jgi:hypothetical protein
MSPKSRDPEVITPQGRPSASVASTATNSVASLGGRTGIAPSNGRGSRSPWVYASVFAPGVVGRRRLWMFTYVCAHCHTGHLGRADSESKVRGPHRGSCGRSVWVLPARTYRAPVERAEGAA